MTLIVLETLPFWFQSVFAASPPCQISRDFSGFLLISSQTFCAIQQLLKLPLVGATTR